MRRKKISVLFVVLFAIVWALAFLLVKSLTSGGHTQAHIQSITVYFSPLVLAQRYMADQSAIYSESQLATLATKRFHITVPVDPHVTWGSLIIAENYGAKAFRAKPERCAIIIVTTDSDTYQLAVTVSEFARWFAQPACEGELIIVGDGLNHCRLFSNTLPCLVTAAVRQDGEAARQLQILGW